MGAIADAVKRYVPASYKALVGATNSYDYSADDLQQIAEYISFRLFSTIAGATQESSVFDRKEIEFMGMLSTLQFIPAAVDYWGDQIKKEGLSGRDEQTEYFDKRRELWKVYEVIAGKAEELGNELGINLDTVVALVPQVSYGDNGRSVLISEDPQDFGQAYSGVSPDDYIPWGS